MPIYIKNLTNSSIDVPVLDITLDPKGQDGSVFNVTSEIRNLTEANYSELQNFQLSNKVHFTKDREEESLDTSPLVIRSTSHVFDDSRTPRAGVATPQSPVYFDSESQGLKTIQVENTDGACQIEFWGSIDASTTDMSTKRWKFLGNVYLSDPTIWVTDRELMTELRKFRFIKVDRIKGSSPKVYFQSIA